MKLRDWPKRLTQMDRAELRDRIRQELAKRMDGFRSHLADGFAPVSLNPTPIPAGNFFNTDSVDAILALLRERFPLHTKEIINRAEKICRHRFDLLGYED